MRSESWLIKFIFITSKQKEPRISKGLLQFDQLWPWIYLIDLNHIELMSSWLEQQAWAWRGLNLCCQVRLHQGQFRAGQSWTHQLDRWIEDWLSFVRAVQDWIPWIDYTLIRLNLGPTILIQADQVRGREREILSGSAQIKRSDIFQHSRPSA